MVQSWCYGQYVAGDEIGVLLWQNLPPILASGPISVVLIVFHYIHQICPNLMHLSILCIWRSQQNAQHLLFTFVLSLASLLLPKIWGAKVDVDLEAMVDGVVVDDFWGL